VSQLRLNPLTGRWVTIAVDRATRPGDLVSQPLPVESGPQRPCPFCPGNEEATPPALESYGTNGTWAVRVIPNLFPAFDGNEPMSVANLGPVFTQATASGIHEVLVFSPDHDASWADLDDRQVGLTMAAIRDRMEDHSRSATVRYTQTIVNHGRAAGASLEHPHGQLLGMPIVPGEIAEEQAGFERFGGDCLLCTTIEAELASTHRLVAYDERVIVLCPYWSGMPYEMLILPRQHCSHLEAADPPDVVAVGRAVRTGIDHLRHLIGKVAYNIVFHSAPHRASGAYHWHVHLYPRVTSIAGFEQGTGVLINIVSPEQAAQDLRRAAAPAA
jgi:UDPglucose--hexose-1-phosphate uridylyltransferase